MIKAAISGGSSWTLSKIQDNFLVLGDLIPKHQIDDPHNCELLLTINGVTKQSDNTGNMIFKINQQIDYLEQVAGIQLREGDLIMTGTPEGIAPVKEGDKLDATISYKGRQISHITERIRRDAKPNFCIVRA